MASDLFNQNTGSAQAIATYGPWAAVGGGFIIPTGNLGEYRSNAAGYCTARYTTDTPSDYHESIVKATAGQLSGGYYAGPAVRVQAGADTSYSVAYIAGEYYLNKVVAGADSVIQGPVSVTISAGESIKLTVETVTGNAQLKVYQNTVGAPTVWTQRGTTATDSSSPITGGTYGIFGYNDVSGSGFGAGAWTGNDLGAAAASATSSRRKKNLIFPGQHAGPFGARIRTRRYNTAPALPTITGTLATTNTDDTSAATGTPTVNGSAAPTNAADTSTASGVVWPQAASRRAKTPVHPGAGPYNLLRFKRSARNNTVAAVSVSGALATTNADDTSAASGTPTVNGSAAPTNANDTLSAAGTTTVTGSLAKTNGNDTSAASGTPTVNGAATPTNANDTAAAAGTTTVTGSLAKTNANDTLAAAGYLPATGTANITEGADTLSAFGVGPAQGGGNGGARKFKSWDQRQRERLEQIEKDKQAKAVSDKFGDLPPALAKAIRDEKPFQRLSPSKVKAYANARAQDDEEAMHVIMALL